MILVILGAKMMYHTLIIFFLKVDQEALKMIVLVYILDVGLIEHSALAGLQRLAGEDPLGMVL